MEALKKRNKKFSIRSKNGKECTIPERRYVLASLKSFLPERKFIKINTQKIDEMKFTFIVENSKIIDTISLDETKILRISFLTVKQRRQILSSSIIVSINTNNSCKTIFFIFLKILFYKVADPYCKLIPSTAAFPLQFCKHSEFFTCVK